MDLLSSSPIPLTIHVIRGKFLVWSPDVCRTLALSYRILGGWAARKQAPQAHVPVAPSPSAASSGSSPTVTTSVDQFPIETLPMSLQAYQVMHLLHEAAETIDIVGGDSVRSLRAASVATRESADQLRLSHLKSTLEKHALYQSSMREKYEHLRKGKKTGRMEEAESKVQTIGTDEAAENSSDDILEPPAKRQKHDDSSSAQAEPSTTAVSVSSSSYTLDELLTAASKDNEESNSELPRGSTLRLVATAFPLTDALLAQHTPSHPTWMSTPVQFPLTQPVRVPKDLNVLDLRIERSYPRDLSKRASREEMERLVCQGICDSLGEDHCRSSHCGTTALPIAPTTYRSTLSPRQRAFLDHYSTFLQLWRDGFFVLPGLHFGCDMVCYEDLPSRVHSSFMVKVLPAFVDSPNATTPPVSLTELEDANLIRMASGVNKVVLVMQPVLDEETTPAADAPTNNPSHADAPSAASSAPSSSSSVPCSCHASFHYAASLLHHTPMRFHSSMAQWQQGTGVRRGGYPDEHARREALHRKDEGTTQQQEEHQQQQQWDSVGMDD